MALTLSHLNHGQFCLAWKSLGSKKRKEMPRSGFQFCRDLEEWGVLGGCTRDVFGMLNSVLWVPSEKWGGSTVWRDWPMLFTQQSTTPCFFLSLAQANVAGNWEFEYMKVGKLLSSSEQIEGSVLFSFQSMKTGSGIKSCKLISEQMAKLLVLSMWGCQCTVAKTACSGLAVLWQATQIPHGNSLVQVTFKTLS